MSRPRKRRTTPDPAPKTPAIAVDGPPQQTNDISLSPSAPDNGPDRDARIAEAAYFLAARRNFCPGRELDDWLTAEREIDSALSRPREEPAMAYLE